MSVPIRLRHFTIRNGRVLAAVIVVAWLGFNAAHGYLPQQPPEQKSDNVHAMARPASGNDLVAHLQADESHWRRTMRDYDGVIAFATRIGDRPISQHISEYNRRDPVASDAVDAHETGPESPDQTLNSIIAQRSFDLN